MRVFVTGATGFIGSMVVRDLLRAGHQVLGLSRSDAGDAALRAVGAEVLRGDVEQLDALESGATRAGGVIHLAFNHDFSKFAQNCENDRRAIEAMADVLAGTDKPFVVTSGTGMGGAVVGRPVTEDDAPVSSSVSPRAASEETASAAAARGVRVAIMRLPQVHDTRKAGLVSYLIATARQKGFVAYVGDGQNQWPAAHVSDVAPLYRLALEKMGRFARYHAVAEEGVSARDGRRPRHGPAHAGAVDRARRGGRVLRLDGPLCRRGHARVEREDAVRARLAARRADDARGSAEARVGVAREERRLSSGCGR